MLEQLPSALGHAMQGLRAGLDQTVFHAVDLRQGMGSIRLASLAFADHAPMPQRCTADGSGVSPPLHWTGVPSAATEVVLIVEDADSPTPQPLVHAIAHGLPTRRPDDGASAAEPKPLRTEEAVAAETGDGALAEAALSEVDELAPTVPMGRNSMLQTRWLPPDPPPGHGVHRYVFQVFALGPGEPISDHPGREALRVAVQQRGLASGCLIGTYERDSADVEQSLRESAGAVAVDLRETPPTSV